MFKILKQSKRSGARLSTLTLSHGKVSAPFFMPIATRGAVRSLAFSDVKSMGAEIVLANTYHLYLRPGIPALKKLGGLHEFTRWDKPILTDSGGYQVFSLAKMRKVSDAGVDFQSHIDGAHVSLTPEESLKAQMIMGVDVAMVLDDVAAYPATHERAADALRRTTLWAKRQAKLAKVSKTKTKVFGIVQGSIYKDLRKQSAEELVSLNFDGYAIGGLSVGEPKKFLREMTKFTAALLPENKPRYLMGVGTPDDIVAAVKNGVDMFDCVIPTRNARHGTLYVNRRWDAKGNLKYDVLKITNSKYALSKNRIDAKCACETCKTTSRAYLRHLFNVGEPLAMHLATIHNVNFYLELMREVRSRIKQGKL